MSDDETTARPRVVPRGRVPYEATVEEMKAFTARRDASVAD